MQDNSLVDPLPAISYPPARRPAKANPTLAVVLKILEQERQRLAIADVGSILPQSAFIGFLWRTAVLAH